MLGIELRFFHFGDRKYYTDLSYGVIPPTRFEVKNTFRLPPQ